MSHQHDAPNSPMKEFKTSILFLIAFVALVAIVFIPALLRPAAPKTIAETLAITTPAATTTTAQ